LIGIDTDILIAYEVRVHPRHAVARATLSQAMAAGERLAFLPQVISEFIHVSTDAKRFSVCLTMDAALQRMQAWQSANETEMIFPNDEALALFSKWMREFQLGRKRVLDTMLAATYFASGLTKLATFNVSDFAIFKAFEFLEIPAELSK